MFETEVEKLLEQLGILQTLIRLHTDKTNSYIDLEFLFD
jgi:hypothetical protein